MVTYAGEMTVEKSCKYVEFGSFEHLLFLCVTVLLVERQAQDMQGDASPRTEGLYRPFGPQGLR